MKRGGGGVAAEAPARVVPHFESALLSALKFNIHLLDLILREMTETSTFETVGAAEPAALRDAICAELARRWQQKTLNGESLVKAEAEKRKYEDVDGTHRTPAINQLRPSPK